MFTDILVQTSKSPSPSVTHAMLAEATAVDDVALGRLRIMVAAARLDAWLLAVVREKVVLTGIVPRRRGIAETVIAIASVTHMVVIVHRRGLGADETTIGQVDGRGRGPDRPPLGIVREARHLMSMRCHCRDVLPGRCLRCRSWLATSLIGMLIYTFSSE